ncbi:hypothetical protein CP533_4507 [Ophiocordyceps camponoti-saundersi (nom. inval.)]|nr:hypothetical protein CP533_4507 [Ophiocordyceps camponoti-saundersi (nom. inval.)]
MTTSRVAPVAKMMPATMQTLRLSVGRASYHGTSCARLAYKDSQDRKTLKPRSNEHTLSARDDDAPDDPSAFDSRVTRPEAEKRRSDDDGALSASPADHDLSKPRGEKGGPQTSLSRGTDEPSIPSHHHGLRSSSTRLTSSASPSSPSTEAAPSSHEAAILRCLSATVNEPETTADSAAESLDKLYPADGDDVGAVEDFLWSLWSLLVGTVKKIPAEDGRQKLLVDVVASLRLRRDQEVELWGQKTRVWTELPMLGPCMRDAWNLRPKLDGSDKDDAAIREWTSLNSFAARMFGADLQPWVNLAIWELRAALEEAPPSTTTARDAGIATVCEWILHAGHHLHRQGLQPRTLDAMEERALKPGKLFQGGDSGLSKARWRFWRERLAELGRDAGSAELRDRAQKAVTQMEELESSGT